MNYWLKGWMFFCIQNDGNFLIFVTHLPVQGNLLSPESSDWDLGGVFLQKKHAKWLASYILQ